MDFLFQLYSARHTPLQESLKIVADAGYAGVEAVGENFADNGAFKTGLEKHKLGVASIHFSLAAMKDDMDACQAIARQYQCQHIVGPFIEEEERPVSAAQWQALGKELAGFQAQWARADCTFAWHNHDFEFIKLPDGSMPIQHLFDTAASVQWEIDVAWIVRAGVDPAIWIDKYLQRISAVHLKDIAPQGECTDEDGWADLGEGVVPWQTLMPRLLRSSAAHYIVEHDNPSDLQRFADRSIKAARALSV